MSLLVLLVLTLDRKSVDLDEMRGKKSGSENERGRLKEEEVPTHRAGDGVGHALLSSRCRETSAETTAQRRTQNTEIEGTEAVRSEGAKEERVGGADDTFAPSTEG